MDWFYPKMRGPEWKQGWTSQTMTAISTPPLPSVSIFAIVIFLLSLSQYTHYKAQLEDTGFNFQLFLILVPVLLIFLVRSSFVNINGTLDFWMPRAWARRDTVHQTGASPWGVVVLVVVLLVLVSYQSSFHSKWFSLIWRFD